MNRPTWDATYTKRIGGVLITHLLAYLRSVMVTNMIAKNVYLVE